MSIDRHSKIEYGSVPENTMEQQMEDYLFVAEEATGYVLGNALALVDPESMETEISTYENNLRRIVAAARKKQAGIFRRAEAFPKAVRKRASLSLLKHFR